MSCNTCARQANRAMGAAGVPASQTQATWAGKNRCPTCGAWVSPGQACANCARLAKSNLVSTHEAAIQGQVFGMGDPLNNPVVAGMYSRYARVVTQKKDRNVDLRAGGGFATDLAGTIYVDAYPLGKDEPIEDQIIVTWGGIEHELSHEKWSPAWMLDRVMEIARGEGEGASLSERARRCAKQVLNTIEDGRIERLLRERVPGAFLRVKGADLLQPRWDEKVGKGVPVVHQVLGAALYEALPNFRVRHEVYEKMSPKAKALFDRVRPLVQQGVHADAEGAMSAALDIVRIMDEESAIPQSYQGPSRHTAVGDFQGSPDADGSACPQPAPDDQSAGDGAGGDDAGDQEGDDQGAGGGAGGDDTGDQEGDDQDAGGGAGGDDTGDQEGDDQGTGGGSGGDDTGDQEGDDQGAGGGAGGDDADDQEGDDQDAGGGAGGDDADDQEGDDQDAGGDGAGSGEAGGDDTVDQGISDGGDGEDILDDLRSEAAAAYSNAVSGFVAETAQREAQRIHDGANGTVKIRTSEGAQIDVKILPPRRSGSPPLHAAIQAHRELYRGAAKRFSRELRAIKTEVKADRPLQRRGKLDRRRIKAAVKGSDRVYVKRGVEVGQDIAVSIQVDRSGSMHGARIDAAVQSTTVTTMALEEADIPYEVRSFGGQGFGGAGQCIHKSFSAPKATDSDLVSLLGCNGSTPMAVALELSRASLSVRDEQVKLGFVLSDGVPNNPESARKAVDAMRAQGVSPVIIFTHPTPPDEYVRTMLNGVFGAGRWEHISSPTGLYRVVTNRIRDIYKAAETKRR